MNYTYKFILFLTLSILFAIPESLNAAAENSGTEAEVREKAKILDQAIKNTSQNYNNLQAAITDEYALMGQKASREDSLANRAAMSYQESVRKQCSLHEDFLYALHRTPVPEYNFKESADNFFRIFRPLFANKIPSYVEYTFGRIVRSFIIKHPSTVSEVEERENQRLRVREMLAEHEQNNSENSKL